MAPRTVKSTRAISLGKNSPESHQVGATSDPKLTWGTVGRFRGSLRVLHFVGAQEKVLRAKLPSVWQDMFADPRLHFPVPELLRIPRQQESPTLGHKLKTLRPRISASHASDALVSAGAAQITAATRGGPDACLPPGRAVHEPQMP